MPLGTLQPGPHVGEIEALKQYFTSGLSYLETMLRTTKPTSCFRLVTNSVMLSIK